MPNKPGSPGRVGKRRDAKREPGFFAHAPVKTRAATVAENSREQIQRRNVRTGHLGDVPRHRELRQLRRKFLVHFAPAKLRRF